MRFGAMNESGGCALGDKRMTWFGDGVTDEQKFTGSWNPGAGRANEALLAYHDACVLRRGTVPDSGDFEGYCYMVVFARHKVVDAVAMLGQYPTWEELLALPAEWFQPNAVLKGYNVTRFETERHHITAGAGVWPFLLAASVVIVRSKPAGLGTYGQVFGHVAHWILASVKDAPNIKPTHRVGKASGLQPTAQFVEGGGFSLNVTSSVDSRVFAGGQLPSAATTYSYVAQGDDYPNAGWQPYDPGVWYGRTAGMVRKSREHPEIMTPGLCYLALIKPDHISEARRQLGVCPTVNELLSASSDWYEDIAEMQSLRLEFGGNSRVHHVGQQGASLLYELVIVAIETEKTLFPVQSLGRCLEEQLPTGFLSSFEVPNSTAARTAMRVRLSDRLGLVTGNGVSVGSGFYDYWSLADNGLAVASMNPDGYLVYATDPSGMCEFKPGVVHDTGWQDFVMTEGCHSWSWFHVPEGVAVVADGFKVMAQDKPLYVILLPGAGLTLSKQVATRLQVAAELPPGVAWTSSLTDKFGSERPLVLERMVCDSASNVLWRDYAERLGLIGLRSRFVSECQICILAASDIPDGFYRSVEPNVVEVSEPYDDFKAVQIHRHHFELGIYTMKSLHVRFPLSVLHGYKAFQEIAMVKLAGVVEILQNAGSLAVDFSRVFPVIEVEDVGPVECSITVQSLVDPDIYDCESD